MVPTSWASLADVNGLYVTCRGYRLLCMLVWSKEYRVFGLFGVFGVAITVIIVGERVSRDKADVFVGCEEDKGRHAEAPG